MKDSIQEFKNRRQIRLDVADFKKRRDRRMHGDELDADRAINLYKEIKDRYTEKKEMPLAVTDYQVRKACRLIKRGLAPDGWRQDTDGNWVTISGTHVLIDPDGIVIGGPENVRTMRLKTASSTSKSVTAKHGMHKANPKSKALKVTKKNAPRMTTSTFAQSLGLIEKTPKLSDTQIGKLASLFDTVPVGAKIIADDFIYKKESDGGFSASIGTTELDTVDSKQFVKELKEMSKFSDSIKYVDGDTEVEISKNDTTKAKEQSASTSKIGPDDIGAVIGVIGYYDNLSDSQIDAISTTLSKIPAGATIDADGITYKKDADGYFNVTGTDGMAPYKVDAKQFVKELKQVTGFASNIKYNDGQKTTEIFNSESQKAVNKAPETKPEPKLTDMISEGVKNTIDDYAKGYISLSEFTSTIKDNIGDMPVGSKIILKDEGTQFGIDATITKGEDSFTAVNNKNGKEYGKQSDGAVTNLLASYIVKANSTIAIDDGGGEVIAKSAKNTESTENKKVKVSQSRASFGDDAFTQERLDNALWSESETEVDKKLAPIASKAFDTFSGDELGAISSYTDGAYASMNRMLYKGKYENGTSEDYYNEKIDSLTSAIAKNKYDFDSWVQRGISYSSLMGLIGDDTLDYDDADELNVSCNGNTYLNKSFMSCGTAKGSGFSEKPVILNIYCPAGTEMLYVEGHSEHNGECETIIQRGSQLKFVGFTKSENSGKLYCDCYVVGQTY